MKKLSTTAPMILGFLMSGAIAAQIPDLIIPGAGAIGTWKTSIQFANGADSAITVRLFAEGIVLSPGAFCPPNACQGALDLTIPANGFGSAVVGDAILGAPAGPSTYYVTLWDGPELPAVSARMFNTAQTSQSFEIPVIRAAELGARNPSVLIFPDGVASERGGRSNLVIASYVGEATFKLDAFAATGVNIGSATYTISPNSTLAVYNVFAAFFSLGGGRELRIPLRVTKLSGDGMIWGYLASVDDGGGVSAAAGSNW